MPCNVKCLVEMTSFRMMTMFACEFQLSHSTALPLDVLFESHLTVPQDWPNSLPPSDTVHKVSHCVLCSKPLLLLTRSITCAASHARMIWGSCSRSQCHVHFPNTQREWAAVLSQNGFLLFVIIQLMSMEQMKTEWGVYFWFWLDFLALEDLILFLLRQDPAWVS